jgi:hypothetical protein
MHMVVVAVPTQLIKDKGRSKLSHLTLHQQREVQTCSKCSIIMEEGSSVIA